MAFNLVTPRRGKSSKRRINAEINVTPLVDVMLVLLVIFMITSPMLVAGVQVDLPKTKASALSGQDEPIAISVDKFGNIYIHETKIKMEELGKKLAAVSQERKDIRIFVRGDKTIDYGRVMQVFGAIKSAGYKNIALVSETINE
ncbi:MAG: TolR biopolymer transport protein [Candidatus Midichloriaceae bacterium]|jgi:biopolymer transport protein TolR|nr:TolR biopolymer transport protein [Candidatus Midichloriaceae bacterium]